jgi:hypothetical protein
VKPYKNTIKKHESTNAGFHKENIMLQNISAHGCATWHSTCKTLFYSINFISGLDASYFYRKKPHLFPNLTLK